MLLRFLLLSLGAAAEHASTVIPVLIGAAIITTAVLLVLAVLPGSRSRGIRTGLPAALVALPAAPAVLPADGSGQLK